MAASLTRRLTSLLLPGARRQYTTAISSLDIAPVQQLSLSERCILVDDRDRVVGDASKLDCHLVGNAGELLLHRAFSVFLFNERRELLVQRRSADKITFPGRYTNACCSHPLWEVAEEREERGAAGVRAAARRRLGHELGVPPREAHPDLMSYVTRIHYRGSEGRFGEHEIDYILVMRADVTLRPNPDEVSEVVFVGREQFDAWVGGRDPPLLTPWFELVVRHRLLHTWWDNLDELEKLKDHENILRYC